MVNLMNQVVNDLFVQKDSDRITWTHHNRRSGHQDIAFQIYCIVSLAAGFVDLVLRNFACSNKRPNLPKKGYAKNLGADHLYRHRHRRPGTPLDMVIIDYKLVATIVKFLSV